MKKIIAFLIITGIIVSVTAIGTVIAKKNGCTTIQNGTLYGSDGDLLVLGYNQWGYNYQAHMFNGNWCDYHPTYRPHGAQHDWCVANMADVELMMKWNDAWLSNKSCDEDNLLDRHYGFDSYIGSSAWLTNHERGSYLRNWDITGDWVLEFDYLDRLYIHDMKVIDNTFTGTGGYPSGGLPYSITWTVAGTIDGDNIEMRIDYDNSSYYVDVIGTIAQNGTMSGTWNNPSQKGVWKSILGTAIGETCSYNYFCKIVAAPADAYVEDGIWYTADGTEIGPVIWGAFATIEEVMNDPCEGNHGIQYRSPAAPGLGVY